MTHEPTLREPEAGSDALAVRTWLSLLACANLVEGRLRRRLQSRFATTMPRFDALAQLARAPEGMTMGELSQRMMVTKGNITGLVDRLVADGLVERMPVPGDRRASVVRLTEAGGALFRRMGPEMQGWIRELLAGLSHRELDDLHELVRAVKESVRAAPADPMPADSMTEETHDRL